VSRILWLSLLGLAVTSEAMESATADQFDIYVPCTGVCPGSARFIAWSVGQPFPIAVAAVGASGERDESYRGTITFSSSDLLATLPAAYTFTAADRGGHLFLDGGTLRTPGRQTISVTDIARGWTGVWAVTALLPAGASEIPTLSSLGRLVFAFLLAALGTWFILVRR
jgi:hypothetical protein